MSDVSGPIGFAHIETAPRDGRYVRLRFRRVEGERLGKWKHDPEMKAGGFWMDMDDCYITPGPLFWASRSTPQPS